MLRTHLFLSIAALSLTLFIAQPALAQHGRGGGGHSGGHGGGGGHAPAHVSASHGGGHVSAPRAAVHTSVAHSVVHSNVNHAVVRGSPSHAAINHGINTAHFNTANHVNAIRPGIAANRAFVNNGTWSGRNGWNGGWNRGWNGWNGGWNGGWGHRNFFGFYFNPFGLFGSPGWFWPYPYSDYGYPYAGVYDYGNYAVPPSGYSSDFAYGPDTAIPQAQSLGGQIDVIVPNANTVIWFNGYQTSTTGLTRHFDTPALQPGQEYSYTVRVAWFAPDGQPMTAERMVRVRAGAQAVVDFTRQEPLPSVIPQ